MRNLIILLGIPIDNLNLHEAINRIDSLVQHGRATHRHHLVVTVNTDFIVKASQDPELRYLLQESDLATADGMPLVWASKLLGAPLQERVAGADMTPMLAERAAQKGYSLFLFGAAPGVAQKAADILMQRYPALKIVGVACPAIPSILEMDPAILTQIKSAQPDILLVALGNPKQEKWIGMYGRQLGVPVMIGVGGSLDFIAGQTKRAPVWMQKTGLEWSFRFIQEPRRLWRRYLVDMVVFSFFFVRQWWAMRAGNTPTISLPNSEVILVENKAVLHLNDQVTIQTVQAVTNAGQEALEKTAQILIDLSQTSFIDSAGIGALVNLAKEARTRGGDAILVAVPTQIQKTLQLLHLHLFFRTYPDLTSAMKSDSTGPHGGSAETATKHFVFTPANPKWATLKGPRRFDASTAPEFRATCTALIKENPNLILDLEDTIILTSAGLAVLVQLHKLSTQQRGELRIIHCSKDVLQTIRLVRLDKILSIQTETANATC